MEDPDARSAGRGSNAWHARCFAMAMNHVDAIEQAFLLLLIVLCLGSCLVRAFWELEQMRARRIATPPSRRTRKPD
jgi:hypothetical protein